MWRDPCDVLGIPRRSGFFLPQMSQNLPYARHVGPRSYFGSPQPKHRLLDVVSNCRIFFFFFVGCVKSIFPLFCRFYLLKFPSCRISVRPAVSAVVSLSASSFLTVSSVASILRAWVMKASSSCSLSRASSLILLKEVPIIIWSCIRVLCIFSFSVL